MLKSLVHNIPNFMFNYTENTSQPNNWQLKSNALKLKVLSHDVISFGNKKYPKRIEETPGLAQINPKFIDNGSTYCAPISAFNGLKWLASEDIIPEIPENSFVDSVKALALYFKNGAQGTTSQNLCSGLEQYFTAKNYPFSEIGYQGYSKLDKYHSGVEIPELDKLRNLIDQKSIVLLNFGCYKKNNDLLTREEGHWVTLVGYDNDNPNVFYIKDPYLSKEENNKGIKINLAELNKGTLDPTENNDEGREKRPATGFNEVTEGGLAYYHHDDYRCVLDGFVYLTV